MRSCGVPQIVQAGKQALPCPSEAEHASGSACFGIDVTFVCFILKQYRHSMQLWLLTHCVLLVGDCWVQRQRVGRLRSWAETVWQVHR